jgi:hypothetical protein
MVEKKIQVDRNEMIVPEEGECVKAGYAEQDHLACQIDGERKVVESDEVEDLDVEVFDADDYF